MLPPTPEKGCADQLAIVELEGATYVTLKVSDPAAEETQTLLAAKYALATYADFVEDRYPHIAADLRTCFKLRNGVWYALKLFQLAVYDCAVAHGWHTEPANVGEKIALMHSELSEALEAARNDAPDDKLPARKGIEVELADCVIRVLDFAESQKLDVVGAMLEKHQFNLNRPYRHGGKKF